jgi:hypothetical protein
MSKSLLKDFMNSPAYKQQEALIAEKKKTLKNGPNVIHLTHISFDKNELDELEAIFQKGGYELSSYDERGIHKMSLDHYSLVNYIIISYPLLKDFSNGIIQNAAWDAIKFGIKYVFNKSNDKTYPVMTASTLEQKEIVFGVKVVIDKNTELDFELKGNLSEEMISGQIDKILSFAEKRNPNPEYKKTYVKFDPQKSEWVEIDVLSELTKQYKKTQKKHKK